MTSLQVRHILLRIVTAVFDRIYGPKMELLLIFCTPSTPSTTRTESSRCTFLMQRDKEFPRDISRSGESVFVRPSF
jgi:hypothetical protein